jgi:aminopeptidase N
VRRRPAAALAAALLVLVGAGPAPAAHRDAAPGPGGAGIGDPYFPRDGNGGYDVAHYAVHVTTAITDGRIAGRTTVTATATRDLSSFHLDLLLPVTSVRVDGRPARFRRPDRHELRVTPAAPIRAGRTFRVRVTYAGRPGRIAWGGERAWLANRHEIVTMGQPHMAAWWFPANDHPRDKARFDVSIRVPRGRQAVSNGGLHARTVGRRWTVFHWRARDPMATYLAFFAAGDFALERGRTAAGTPYVLAVSERLDPAERRRALALLRRTPVVQAWLERRLGRYPFRWTGGLVTSLRPGFALENQTRPTYPSLGGAGQDWIVAHELAHQWLGDSVSVRSWRDIWLNEGLATWFEVRWDDFGGSASMAEWLSSTWESHADDPSFWDLPVDDPGRTRLFDEAVYVRGAMTVQALRNRIGGTAVDTLLRRWVAERRHGTGATADFVALAEEVSGEDLTGFFTAWLRSPERPARTAGNGLA